MSLDIKKTLQQEFNSFKTPPAKEVSPVPQVGAQAPESPALILPHDKPSIIFFLRHCGCAFAEKAFRALTQFSYKHPEIYCVAVSHSSRTATDAWVVEVGGEWEVDVVVDEQRDLYALWGLGLSSYWHTMGPKAVYSAYRLGVDEGVWNRATESGSRWQTAGAFAVDESGVVRWSQPARNADDVPDLKQILAALQAPAPGSS